MNDEEPVVTVFETTMQSQVAVVRMAFEDAGIPFSAVNETVSTIFPVDGMAIVHFQVLKSDVARAREVVSELGLA